MAKRFADLSDANSALAISLEEEDGRIYADFADGLRETYPTSARVFEEMQAEESQHRARLIELYQQKFGEHIPLIRRQDVKGFVDRPPVWLVRPLGLHRARKQAEIMELETRRSTSGPSRKSATPPSASCWATWRTPSDAIRPRPARWSASC
jgi:rubrerythrin